MTLRSARRGRTAHYLLRSSVKTAAAKKTVHFDESVTVLEIPHKSDVHRTPIECLSEPAASSALPPRSSLKQLRRPIPFGAYCPAEPCDLSAYTWEDEEKEAAGQDTLVVAMAGLSMDEVCLMFQ